MKSLFLGLLLAPSLLFAQETPSEPKEAVIIETFDTRCQSELLYGVQLIGGRQRGVTAYDVLLAMQTQRKSGNLKHYREDVISYMIDLVLVVYNAEDVTSVDGTITVMRELEQKCVNFKTVEPKLKPDSIST